jgi:hypothetical protein
MTEQPEPKIVITDAQIEAWLKEDKADPKPMAMLNRANFVALLAELKANRKTVEALKLKTEGQDGLLTAYRLGRRPSEATFKKLEKAARLLEQIK